MADKPPKFKLTRNERGEHAMNRIICYIAAVALTLGFLKEAWTNGLEWLDYIGFSIGMAGAYSPVLAVKIWSLWKGQGGKSDTPTLGEQPAKPEVADGAL